MPSLALIYFTELNLDNYGVVFSGRIDGKMLNFYSNEQAYALL